MKEDSAGEIISGTSRQVQATCVSDWFTRILKHIYDIIHNLYDRCSDEKNAQPGL